MQPLGSYLEIEMKEDIAGPLLLDNLYLLAVVKRVPHGDTTGLKPGDNIWILRNRQIQAYGATFIHGEHILLYGHQISSRSDRLLST